MSSSSEIDSSNSLTIQQESSQQVTRRVHFPSDESQLRMISIAPEPFANHPLHSLGVILQRYRAACQRLQIRPLNSLLDQLTTMDDDRRSFEDRLFSLKLTNEKLDIKQMDAIEEILSRCRFFRIDLESSIYDDTTLIQFFDVIEYYESCTHLNLSNYRSMGVQAYQALARYLRRTRCLERLDMNYVRFDDNSMLAFGRALRLASTLYELHLESCQLNGKILQKFIQNLRTCSTIRELYLCDNRLQVQDAPLINELIRSCGQFLRLLDLRSNALQDNGMSHIASQLSNYDEQHKQQNRISKISFQANQLTQQGVAFLAKCLLHNRTIHSLNLSQNNLMNEGLFLLRDALLTNRTINELILRNCRLTDQAAIALAEFIAESSTIQYIDLRENNIQASGICGIAIAMKTNQSLLRIDIDSNLSGLTNSQSSTGSNIDRTNNTNTNNNNTSLLSFSNLRRMAVGFGSLTNNNTTNGNGSTNTQELIEQKSKWLNDINNLCQRNLVIYEEQLRQQEEEEQQQLRSQSTEANLPTLIVSESTNVNGIDEHLSPNDIQLEESPLNSDTSDQTISSIEANSENDLFDETKDKENLPVEPVTESSMINDNELEKVNANATEFLPNDLNSEGLSSMPVPPDSSFSLLDASDESPTDGDEEEEEKEENKRKIHHSDSLHLLRKKTAHETDKITDELPSIDRIDEEENVDQN